MVHVVQQTLLDQMHHLQRHFANQWDHPWPCTRITLNRQQLNCCRFSVVLVQGQGWSHWFAKIILSLFVNLNGPDLRGKEIAFVKNFFVMSTPVDEFDEELSCACLSWATDDGLKHFASFNNAKPKMFEAGEWYRLVSFLSNLFMHHVRSNDFVFLCSLLVLWPARRYYKCFHQCREHTKQHGNETFTKDARNKKNLQQMFYTVIRPHCCPVEHSWHQYPGIYGA